MALMRDGGGDAPREARGRWCRRRAARLAGVRGPVLMVPALMAPALLALVVAAAPARAQTHPSPAKGAARPSVPSVSSLAARGFEVKTVSRGQGLILQKGGEVYWCTMSLAQTRPMSYRSQCYAVR